MFHFYLQTRPFVPREDGPRVSTQREQQLVNHFNSPVIVNVRNAAISFEHLVQPPKQTTARAVAD